MLREHSALLEEQLQASVQKLQRQEQRMEETFDIFLRKRQSMETLSGQRLLGSVGGQDANAQFCEDLAAKIQARMEDRFQAMQRSHVDEVGKLLKAMSFGNLGPAGSVKMRYGNGESCYASEEHAAEVDRKVPDDGTSQRKHTRDFDALVAMQGLSEKDTGPTRARSVRERSSNFVSSLFSAESLGLPSSRHLREFGIYLDVASVVFILINCAWIGIEAEMSIDAVRNRELMPNWVGGIEVFFAVVFSFELGFRFLLQGPQFFKCPNLGLNLFDFMIIIFQITDAVFSFYKVSWLRTFRILRLFNAARIVRSFEYVRELRLLASALSSGVSSLCWVLLTLFFALYICSVFVLHMINRHFEENTSTVDSTLLQYYGSIGNCMLSLFMAISGGAPWETLLQPLKEVSPLFVPAFVLFVMCIVYGLLNIVTAIFVESLNVLAQKDTEMRTKDLERSKFSLIGDLRDTLEASDESRSGFLSVEEMEEHLQNPEVTQKIKKVGMEIWEARGLFQLLDTDYLGRVSIEEFLHGLIRMKCKDQKVDLPTVMYENKRILTRLLAFMRFSEDHFREIQTALGMNTDNSRRRARLDQYLKDLQSSTRDEDTTTMSAAVSAARGH